MPDSADSNCALYAVVVATSEWQAAMDRGIQCNANTLENDSAIVSEIIKWQQEYSDKYMGNRSDTNPYGRPTDTSETKKWPTECQEWQAAYNEFVQKCQAVTNQKNAIVQSTDQELQTLGNASQQASQMSSTVIQPINTAGNLLGQPL